MCCRCSVLRTKRVPHSPPTLTPELKPSTSTGREGERSGVLRVSQDCGPSCMTNCPVPNACCGEVEPQRRRSDLVAQASSQLSYSAWPWPSRAARRGYCSEACCSEGARLVIGKLVRRAARCRKPKRQQRARWAGRILRDSEECPPRRACDKTVAIGSGAGSIRTSERVSGAASGRASGHPAPAAKEARSNTMPDIATGKRMCPIQSYRRRGGRFCMRRPERWMEPSASATARPTNLNTKRSRERRAETRSKQPLLHCERATQFKSPPLHAAQVFAAAGTAAHPLLLKFYFFLKDLFKTRSLNEKKGISRQLEAVQYGRHCASEDEQCSAPQKRFPNT